MGKENWPHSKLILKSLFTALKEGTPLPLSCQCTGRPRLPQASLYCSPPCQQLTCHDSFLFVQLLENAKHQPACFAKAVPCVCGSPQPSLCSPWLSSDLFILHISIQASLWCQPKSQPHLSLFALRSHSAMFPSLEVISSLSNDTYSTVGDVLCLLPIRLMRVGSTFF